MTVPTTHLQIRKPPDTTEVKQPTRDDDRAKVTARLPQLLRTKRRADGAPVANATERLRRPDDRNGWPLKRHRQSQEG